MKYQELRQQLQSVLEQLETLKKESLELRDSVSKWKDSWFHLRELYAKLWWHHPVLNSDSQLDYFRNNLKKLGETMCHCYVCREAFKEAIVKYEPQIKEKYSFAEYEFGIEAGESGSSHVDDSGNRIYVLFMRRKDNLCDFQITINDSTGEITDDL